MLRDIDYVLLEIQRLAPPAWIMHLNSPSPSLKNAIPALANRFISA